MPDLTSYMLGRICVERLATGGRRLTHPSGVETIEDAAALIADRAMFVADIQQATNNLAAFDVEMVKLQALTPTEIVEGRING